MVNERNSNTGWTDHDSSCLNKLKTALFGIHKCCSSLDDVSSIYIIIDMVTSIICKSKSELCIFGHRFYKPVTYEFTLVRPSVCPLVSHEYIFAMETRKALKFYTKVAYHDMKKCTRPFFD